MSSIYSNIGEPTKHTKKSVSLRRLASSHSRFIVLYVYIRQRRDFCSDVSHRNCVCINIALACLAHHRNATHNACCGKQMCLRCFNSHYRWWWLFFFPWAAMLRVPSFSQFDPNINSCACLFIPITYYNTIQPSRQK